MSIEAICCGGSVFETCHCKKGVDHWWIYWTLDWNSCHDL